MSTPRWDHPEDYAFTASLSIGQWMWEFLRRNPAYREDWEWFDATWRTLEGRYGRPPNRDFARWEADPLAWRSVADDDCGECRIDQDRVKIECWMGARWGFYKFPLSPDTDAPVIGEQLSWREREQPVIELDAGDIGDTGGARVALAFDLAMPLRPQLEAARRFLQVRQAGLRRRGELEMCTVATQAGRWRLMLQVLDAGAQGVARARLFAWLRRQPGFEGEPEEFLAAARALVEGGYLELHGIPQGGASR